MKPMKPSQILLAHYAAVQALFARYGVREVRIFGSIARCEDHPGSDIDWIAEFPADFSLFQLAELRWELEQVLQLPFELLSFAALNPAVREVFRQNSIALEELPALTAANALPNRFLGEDRRRKNLNSLLWTIGRIEQAMAAATEAEIQHNCVIQDAITRNIQLLSQICLQLSAADRAELEQQYRLRLTPLIALRDPLFMSVDYAMLWQTLNRELPELKRAIAAAADAQPKA